jgi:hypothetical protein
VKADLKKPCYKLYQQVVVARDIFCQRPGCHKPATAGHHVFGRANMGTAFEPDGGLGLCMDCHDGWARQCPMTVHDVLRRKVGPKRYNELQTLSNTVVKLREYDLKDIADFLGNMLKKINNRPEKVFL